MKAVILAGGFGTRISEETHLIPKPMVEIAGKPILWHIMKYLSEFNIKEFIICLGYKGYIIKEYFYNYSLHNSDIRISLKDRSIKYYNNKNENWIIHLVDTGLNTQTGGRLKRIKEYIGKETFLFTYGDGLANININKLIKFHLKNKKKATVTAVNPPGRYGALEISDNLTKKFIEKPRGDVGLINGGYFILDPKCLDTIKGNDTSWEDHPLQQLVKNKELAAFKHTDFWHAMDTIRDKKYLENLWINGEAPWKIWA